MPMFDYLCLDCQNNFEDLIFGDEEVVCPKCGKQNTKRMVSVPSPLKTGAFPYKVGPVHSRVSMSSQNASCQSSCSGSCSSDS